MTASSGLPLEERMTSSDLVAELMRRAPQLGGNCGVWPGLTIYRFTAPLEPTWEEITSLSLGVVAQGRKRVTVGEHAYVYDPFKYLVLKSHMHFQAEIVEASPAKPFLSLVLQIDPAVVRKVSIEMLEQRSPVIGRPGPAPESPGFVSAVDVPLMGGVLRFLRSLDSGSDRRILAPAYLQEIVYRILQAEQYARLLELAADQHHNDPVATVTAYARERLSEPLTVADLAERVSLSPSALSALFRESTGRSPYQLIKEMRLNRARDLLVEGTNTVACVSRAVGYATPSHFTNEFRRRFGMSPKAYGDLHSLRADLDPLHAVRPGEA